MTVDEAFDNVTIYIVSFPEGAGNAFIGYLQQVYLGNMKPINIDKNHSWSGEFRTGVSIFNLFPSALEKFEFPIENPGKIDNKLGERLQELWGTPSSHWTRLNGLTTRRFDERKKLIFGLANTIASMKQHKTRDGDFGIILYTHYYPYGVESIHKYFKNVKHLFALNPSDLDTQIYCENLKYVKKDNQEQHDPEEILSKAKLVTKTYTDILDQYPADVNIDYKKFFFDRDENEIKKLILGTLDVNEFDNTKLKPISDMIKSYTKINIELSSHLTFSPKFQEVLRNVA